MPGGGGALNIPPFKIRGLDPGRFWGVQQSVCLPLGSGNPRWDQQDVPAPQHSCLLIPFVLILLRTLLHFFAFTKNSTLFFSSNSALFVKKHDWASPRKRYVRSRGRHLRFFRPFGGFFTGSQNVSP